MNRAGLWIGAVMFFIATSAVCADDAMERHNRQFLQKWEQDQKTNPNPHRDTKEYKAADSETRKKVDEAVEQQRQRRQGSGGGSGKAIE